MLELPKKEWSFLFKKADKDLKNTLVAIPKDNVVLVKLAATHSYDDLADNYGGIVQDSLDSEFEATEDTYHLEYIWDNYLIGIKNS